jgi:transcriptional regulator with XRE-family HTH domain
MTEGHQLLRTFLERHGISSARCARALGVTRGNVTHWLGRGQRPRAEHREAIARWTRGFVPVAAWLTNEERAAVAAVVPFRSARAA